VTLVAADRSQEVELERGWTLTRVAWGHVVGLPFVRLAADCLIEDSRMSRNLNIFSKCILGCGLALAVLVPLGSAHARGLVLYSFCSVANCTDGADPTAGLIADGAGNLYGTTYLGGADGDGVVFKLAPNGTETVLYSFTGGSDGWTPRPA
jgi:uncharacterized repeat protein (TIGR03803 family)